MINLYHGNYKKVLATATADLIFTSPPYNIGSRAPAKTGMRSLGKYDPKSFGAIRDYPDSLPESVYQDDQEAFLIWCANHLSKNGVLVYNHKPRRNGRMVHPAEWFLRESVRSRLTLMEEIIWDRGSTHNHCMQMAWQTTERLYVFKRVDGQYLFKNSSGFTDIWRLNKAKSNGHNAPFPLPLAERVIEAWSVPGAMVCDPYSGSGTTAKAAQALGRRFVGSEILRKYYKLAQERLAA